MQVRADSLASNPLPRLIPHTKEDTLKLYVWRLYHASPPAPSARLRLTSHYRVFLVQDIIIPEGVRTSHPLSSSGRDDD